MRLFVLIMAYTIVLVGCNTAKQAKQQPKDDQPTTVAKAEALFQLVEYDGDSKLRTEARKAATDFVKSNVPRGNVKGVSSQLYQYVVFWVDIDLELEGKRHTISCNVQRFFPEMGDPYWKVTLLSDDLKERMHKADDAATLRELNDAKAQLSNREADEAER